MINKNYILLVIVMAFWGISWPVARLIVGQGTPFLVGFFRFLFSSILFFIIMIIERKNTPDMTVNPKPQYFSLFILGLTGIFGYGILFLYGMKYTTASQGAVLAGFQPVIISTVAHFWHKERISPRWKYIGFLVSFLGVVVIIGIQPLLEFNQNYFVGNLLVLGAFGCWALYTNFGKKIMMANSPIKITAWSSYFGTILFGICSVFENKWTTLQTTTSVFWIGVLVLAAGTTVLAYILYFYVIQQIGVTRVGIFINLVPVFGTIFSIIILKETLPWTLFLGLILISIGIVIINWFVGITTNNPKSDE